MKILIIGSEGFIGRNCKKYFSDKNNSVFGADIVKLNAENYFFINSENPDFNSVFAAIVPDVCINASGSADVGFSIKSPEKDFQLNVKNVELILDAVKRSSPQCKIINFSSAAVYGNPKHLPVSEKDEKNPLSPYGWHKLQSEELLSKYSQEHNLYTCSLRVFSAYGVGLKKQLFWDIYKKYLKSKNITLFGTGGESRDFIFIDDLIHAIDIIIQYKKFNGEPINVSSGIETKINDAAGLFLSELGNDFGLNFSGEEKSGDPKNWRADISQLHALGFKPFVTFEQGIKRYAQWLKENE